MCKSKILHIFVINQTDFDMKFTGYERPILLKTALRIEAGYALSGNECENIENGGSF